MRVTDDQLAAALPEDRRERVPNRLAGSTGGCTSCTVPDTRTIESRELTEPVGTWVPPAAVRSTASDELLERCAHVLEREGLLGPEALQSCCPSAAACWQGRPTDRPVLARLPWVGPRYEDTRVVVVGLNAQTHGGLWDEAHCVIRAGQQLRLGRQRFFGADGRTTSWFHYRSAVVAALLTDLVAARDPVVPSPAASTEALQCTARIQAVQCVPGTNARRTPTRTMLRSCPDRVLWPMIDCLGPRVIAVLGTEPRQALERHFGTRLEPLSGLLHTGEISLATGTARVVALRHPSSGYGMQSIYALQAAISTGEITELAE